VSPTVSVLLPVRDGVAHLAEAIQSLEAQTLADSEVLAVDDGSLSAGASVRVRVADESGGAVEGARVELFAVETDTRISPGPRFSAEIQVARRAKHVATWDEFAAPRRRTNVEGVLVWSEVPPGRCRVRVPAPGFEPAEAIAALEVGAVASVAVELRADAR
jgi:hypothetical protein